RTFAELAPDVQQQILQTIVSFTVLPPGLSIDDQVQIFAKINQIGTPLSHHDIRLALFQHSIRVDFFRLAGVTDPEHPDVRGIVHHSKSQHGLTYPWQSADAWTTWWGRSSKGQAPSETILLAWMVRHRKIVAHLLEQIRAGTHVLPGIVSKDTVQAVLNILCAQFAYNDTECEQDSGDGTPMSPRLPSLETLQGWFREFETWFLAVRQYCPKAKPGSRRKLAVFLGLAPDVFEKAGQLKEPQWELINLLLTGKLDDITNRWSEPVQIRGKWATQLDYVNWMREILQDIAAQ
ncbi:MAG: hypothetical protein MJE77_24190, partial [Proteobacteria bacterium]|nr:hypothetical protein [Pseudomonadota bacterium]